MFVGFCSDVFLWLSYVFVYVCVCTCSSRWALSQQGESGQPRKPWCGSHWSKKNLVMIGSTHICSAWELAAYWLTSRDRWEFKSHHHCMLASHFNICATCAGVPPCDGAVCSLSWAAHGLNTNMCFRSYEGNIQSCLLLIQDKCFLDNNLWWVTKT